MGVSRRAVLMAGAVAGLGVPVLTGCTSAPAPEAGPRTDPVALAMHLHSSFSEGTASMATHLDQARRVGVDVLFWTDHDFRVSAQGYRRRLALEGWTSTEDGVELTWRRRVEGDLRGADVTFDGGAGTFTATGAGTLWLDAEAWNSTYSGSLADTTLTVGLDPGGLGPDAYVAVQLDLSFHPASGGRAAGKYRLTYRIGLPAGHRARARDGEVDVPAAAGVALRPVEDIRALWPDLVAEDNSMHRVRVGLVVRGTGTATVRGIDLTRTRRGDSLALVRDVMARYAERYPDRRQYAALEVSLVRHLNWFGAELVMPDYGDRAPRKDDSVAAAEAMVASIHRHGGLASCNHPLGRSRVDTAAEFVRTRALGADLVEVAYADQGTVEGMLHVLDACARNLVLVTGTGVTDDHSGTDWYGNAKSNWITRVWAPSADLPDLLSALAAGKAWCYKPDGWDGTLRTTVAGVEATGVVATGRQAVTVTASDLPKDGALEVVTGRADRGGPEPATRAATARGGEHSLELDPGQYVRAVVRDAGGRIVGVGNPTWVLTDHTGVPAARQLRS